MHLDLLKVCSFLHLQRIRVDFFLRAGLNPVLETRGRQKRDQQDRDIKDCNEAQYNLGSDLQKDWP